ncbi:hypothetical protein VTK73DRAFT_9865 [Phialemonium thermophilum]|uniref:Defective in cullin neddylation protein n=1 Tax=Phialemonium thermophilum TaxID=223376 RepID=A0ABR3XJ86_9PEZI
MPPTPTQRTMVSQFVALTGAQDKVAQRFLKNAGFKLEVAVDQYYNSGQAGQASSKVDTALDKMFDDIRDPSQDEKDVIGVDSMMAYLTSLGVNPESCEIFVVLEIVQAAGFGQITRKGYINGWKATNVAANPSAHKSYVRECIARLSSDPSYFKKVYRHTFIAGKEPDQKALSLENALVYWDLIFSPPGRPWATSKKNWLADWKRFLEEKWKHSVNKDMWNQTLEFANKTMADESLSFWSEDAAWPSVIDQFVLWLREADKQPGGGGTVGASMEVD